MGDIITKGTYRLQRQKKPITQPSINPSTPPTPTGTKLGQYVNKLSEIIADNAKKTALKSFIVAKKLYFNIFYTGDVLSTSQNRTYMRTLLSEISGVKGANVTKSINAINESDLSTPAGYNTTCTTAAEKFTMLSQEWEFWKTNTTGTFEEFKTNDLAIYNYCQSNNLLYNIYVARCKDYQGIFEDAEVADWVVAYHDTIYLVDYISTEKYNTYKGLSQGIKDQIILIADAAKRANKIQNISILWASEGNLVNGVPTNMRTFFEQNKTLVPAYDGFIAAYKDFNFTNKLSVKFTGQNVYAYDSLKDL
jgi:hypothetical protein